MQNFTFHTHNNALGIYDGRSSAEDMISKAEELGFEAIGISNHLIWHPNMSLSSKMFFRDWNKAYDVAQKGLDIAKKAAERHKIKVFYGFEVDFFPSKIWRNGFEKLISKLNIDYIIGSTHTIRTDDESNIYNIYHLDELPNDISDCEKEALLKNYWENIVSCINSGYFDFIAHIDYCDIINLCLEEKWNIYREKVIKALIDKKQAYEINTSGFRRIGRPHPNVWMIEELNKGNVPVLLSDDAHCTEHIGGYFSEAEQLLANIKYNKRWKYEKI